MLARLAHLVHRRRGRFIAAWVVLIVVGLFATMRVSDRWFESFSIPGYSAYETNQKVVKTFKSGEQAPLVAVFKSSGDVTKQDLQPAIEKAAAVNPGSRINSYFDTHNSAYVSKDRHTTFAEIYPPGQNTFSTTPRIKTVRAALQANAPPGVETNLTGLLPLYDASSGGGSGPSVLTEALIGGFGALVILLFVFGTVPAVAIPLVIALTSILNTFTLVWLLTYVTDVSIIVQFLIALVGLGVAIDYALLMIFRFREELASGEDVETALEQTMTHAGRSVIVSGSTVAVGLLSMVLLPLPFIRSIGIGGMLIPAVSVIVSITLLPALLSLLGHRINRLRVMPKRFVTLADPELGWWGKWAWFVVRRPLAMAAVGIVIVGVLVGLGLQLNPSEAQAKDFPGQGDAVTGREALASAGISAGVMKPFIILTPAGEAGLVVQRVGGVEGISGVTAPQSWQKDGVALVEAIPSCRRFEQVGAGDDLAREGRPARGCEPRRRRAGGPRLRACGVRELPVRPAVRRSLDLHPAGPRVSLAAAAVEGRVPESGLSRSSLRDHRLHLPAGPRLRSDLGRACHAIDHSVDPADDLRLPVRALDGLRGLPVDPHT